MCQIKGVSLLFYLFQLWLRGSTAVSCSSVHGNIDIEQTASENEQ
jgi:hypothetical protein